MTAEINGIFHPVICVSNMREAVAFYGGTLGLKQTFDDMHDPAAISRLFGFVAPVVRSVVFECPDRSEFELVEYSQPKGRQSTDVEMNDAGITALALRSTELWSLSVGSRRPVTACCRELSNRCCRTGRYCGSRSALRRTTSR